MFVPTRPPSRWRWGALVLLPALLSGCLESSRSGDPDGDGVRGAVTFAKSYGGPGEDFAADATPTRDGGYALVGHGGVGSLRDLDQCGEGLNNRRCQDTMIWLTRLDAVGDVMWSSGYYEDAFAQYRGSAPVGDGTYWTFGNDGGLLVATRIEESTGVTMAEFTQTARQPRTNCFNPTRPLIATFTAGATEPDGSLYAVAVVSDNYDPTPENDTCGLVKHRSTYLYRIGPQGQFRWTELISSVPDTRLYSGRTDQLIVLDDRVFFVGRHLESGATRAGDIMLAAYRRDSLRLWRTLLDDYFDVEGLAKLSDRDGDGRVDQLIVGGNEVDCAFFSFCQRKDDDAGIAAVALDDGRVRWRRSLGNWVSSTALAPHCYPDSRGCIVFVAGRAERREGRKRIGLKRMVILDAQNGDEIRSGAFVAGDSTNPFAFGPYDARPSLTHPDGFEAIFDLTHLRRSHDVDKTTYAEIGADLRVISHERRPGPFTFAPTVNAEPLQISELSGRAVAEAGDGGLAVLGTTTVRYGENGEDGGRRSPWLLRTDDLGRPLWRYRLLGARLNTGAQSRAQGMAPYSLVANGDVLMFAANLGRLLGLVAIGDGGDLRWAAGTGQFGNRATTSRVVATDDGGAVMAVDEPPHIARFSRAGQLEYRLDGGALDRAPLTFEGLTMSEGTLWALARVTPTALDSLGEEQGQGTDGNRDLLLGRFVLIAFDVTTGETLAARQVTLPPNGRFGHLAFESMQLAQGPNGGVWVTLTGGDETDRGGAENLLLARFDAAGELLVATAYGGLMPETLASARATDDGGLVLTATSESLGQSHDAWVLRVGSDGEIVPGCNARLDVIASDIPFSSEILETAALVQRADLEANPPESIALDELELEPLPLPQYELQPVVARQCEGEAVSTDVLPPPPVDPTFGIRVLGGAFDYYTVTPSYADRCTSGFCSGEVDFGETFTLQLDTFRERELVYIYGCDTYESGTCTVTVQADREVFMAFEESEVPGLSRELALEVVGDGRLQVPALGFECAGIDTSCLQEWPSQSSVLVQAEDTERSVFDRWDRCDGLVFDNLCELAPASDVVARARFVARPAPPPLPGPPPPPPPSEGALVRFTASTMGRGAVRVVAPNGGVCTTTDVSACVYEEAAIGEQYTLTPLADEGQQFQFWGAGVCSQFGTVIPLVLTLTEPLAQGEERIRCVATFSDY